MSGRSLSIINSRLNILQKYCPSEFARRSRSLDLSSKYKATEFRQFLLYTGPVVTFGLLNDEVYKHFLFLHAALRILVSNSPLRQQLNFAELALQKFVPRCKNLYGSTFITYNVHGLLHFTDDVRWFGNLDSFSVFPYENNMSIFRKCCRKPGLPLQQFFNRMSEKEIHGTTNGCDIDFSIRTSLLRNNNNNNPQYQNISFKNMLLGIDTRDNCCFLRDGSICIVTEITVDNNVNNNYRLGVKRFLNVDDFYDIGLVSSSFQLFKCGTLSSDKFYISLDEVQAKCYRMPLWDRPSMDDSDNDEDHLETQYIVAVIIHSEKK